MRRFFRLTLLTMSSSAPDPSSHGISESPEFMRVTQPERFAIFERNTSAQATAMAIPFVDLKAQYRSIQADIDRAIAAVIADAAFIGGRDNPYVRRFEDEFAKFLDVRHCIGCANGTDSIEILLKAMGVGPGDEVIVPANSWISTAEAVGTVGATPVFVDSHPAYFTIDPAGIEAKITSRTKAIIPVHLYGLPAEMDPIMSIARRQRLYVLEDCAQAHGAYYRGRMVGTFGDRSEEHTS